MNAGIQIATVFSGIGAFEYALKRLKVPHTIKFAADIDSHVQRSYLANYNLKNGKWYDDIKHIEGTKYKGSIDILMGSSPCQSFSVAGNHRGLNDPRGQLVFDYIELIREISPKIFIYENVKNLLTHNNGSTWKKISEKLDTLPHKWHYTIMNAMHYGIPQKRRRLFIVGFLDHQMYNSFNFPVKRKLQSILTDFLLDHIHSPFNGHFHNFAKEFNLQGEFLMESSYSIPDKYFLSKKMIKYVLTHDTGNFKNTVKIGETVANTLVASMHKMHRAGIDNYIPYGPRLRRLHPKESLRLMGFDDRFQIVVSDTQIYRQAGNSVVVDVIIALLVELSKIYPKIEIPYQLSINEGLTPQISLLNFL